MFISKFTQDDFFLKIFNNQCNSGNLAVETKVLKQSTCIQGTIKTNLDTKLDKVLHRVHSINLPKYILQLH